MKRIYWNNSNVAARVNANLDDFLFFLYSFFSLLSTATIFVVTLLPPPSSSSSSSLPFGRDVLLLLGERSEAVVSEESLAVSPHEALDALAPPAGVSVAAALEHQRPAQDGSGGNVGFRSAE